MWNRTSVTCMMGMLLLAGGVVLRMYMTLRTSALNRFLRDFSLVKKEYASLVTRGEAPSWVPGWSAVLIALGIAIAFGAVLIFK
jgi:hypothetical protein